MSGPSPAADTGSWRGRFAGAVQLAAAAAAYLCFALPADLYVGNPSEFVSAWPTLLAPFAAGAVVAVLAVSVLAACLPQRAYRRALVLSATLCVLAWVQGSLLVWQYGLLNGTLLSLHQDNWRGYVDGALWIGALLAVDAYRDRLVRVLPRIAVVACLLQALFSLGLLATRGGGSALAPASERQLHALSEFSPRSNVLHILADGMQGDVVADLLDEDGGRLRREFDGFVFYADNLGAYPYTHMSVPAMLGGRLYDNSQPQGPFLDEALGHGSILGLARAAGFEVEAGVPAGGVREVYRHLTDARLVVLPGSLASTQWNSARQEALRLADLSLFRIVPHFAKPYVYNEQAWLLQTLLGNTAVPGRAFLAHTGFLRELAAHATATRARPTYKYLHLMLSHRPMVMNRDCSYAARVLVPDREHVRDQSRCALRAIAAVLARMRQLGIYDSATVVVSGDHGSFLPPSSLASGSEGAREAFAHGIAPGNVGQARPALLVKRPHARGAVLVSQAPTSIVDIPATIADAAGIPGEVEGVSAFRLPPGEARERRFFLYEYLAEQWTGAYLAPMQEFVVRGRSDDPGSWSAGRTRAPGSAQR